MKKLIIKVKNAKKDELTSIARRMSKQWAEGLIIIPDDYIYQIIDEDWTSVEKQAPPKGQMVLTWIEREENGTVEQTYGFGKWDGDGWIVFLQDASKVIAWMALPEPYIAGVV